MIQSSKSSLSPAWLGGCGRVFDAAAGASQSLSPSHPPACRATRLLRTWGVLLFYAATMLPRDGTSRGADESPDVPRTAVLHLTSGDFVPGELRSSDDPAVLRWQSPLFVRPFEFSISGVNAVHYLAPPELPKPSGE